MDMWYKRHSCIFCRYGDVGVPIPTECPEDYVLFNGSPLSLHANPEEFVLEGWGLALLPSQPNLPHATDPLTQRLTSASLPVTSRASRRLQRVNDVPTSHLNPRLYGMWPELPSGDPRAESATSRAERKHERWRRDSHHTGRLEDNFRKSTLSTLDRNLNPDLQIIGSSVYCESEACFLDHLITDPAIHGERRNQPRTTISHLSPVRVLAIMSSHEENHAILVMREAALVMTSLCKKKMKHRRWWNTDLYKTH
uniref:Uncharacterized protein n=1 Tax=Timema shepardi TaxID=629360 RepID=A0A7R9AZ56_TIMSH|nr:unnamed protein product [Timema shepardi]